MIIPTRPRKPCNFPGCPKLIEAGNTYCEEHRKKEVSRRNKRYDRYDRDERAKKFYANRAWRRLRKIQLNEQPLCEMCLEEGITKQADMVDHVVPIQVDWSLRLKKDNLQSLCNKCHAVKSAGDRERYDM